MLHMLKGIVMSTDTTTADAHAQVTPALKQSWPGKQDRLTARLSTVQKDMLQQAADIEGRTLTDFVLTHAQEAAQRTIREQAVLRLSERDSIAFMEALLSPWEPGEELRADIREMRDLFGDD